MTNETTPARGPRFVVGIDPLLSAAHLCRFTEGESVPVPLLIEAAGLPDGDRTLAAQVARIDSIASSVLEAVTKRGVPTLVAVAAPAVGRNDASGPRRAGLIGEIERRLIDRKIPTVEVTSAMLSKWVTSRVHKKSFRQVEEAIIDSWRPQRFTPERGRTWTDLLTAGYRPTTVAMAAAAAAAAGIETDRKVTNADLAVLGELRPHLPKGWEMPVNESFWPQQCGPQPEKAVAVEKEEGAA